jgi:putative ABC transport system permease protein
MVFVFQERLLESRGPIQRARVWARGCGDLLFHGLAERWEERFGSRSRTRLVGQGPQDEFTNRKDRPSMVWDQLRQDLSYSFRTLRRSPVYTGVVVVTLGVGIALNTLVFSVMNPFLLRPLPYDGAENLVHLGGVDRIEGWDGGRFSIPQFADLQERSRSMEELAGYYYGTLNLSGDQAAEQVMTSWGTGNLFGLLGVQATLGRALSPEDDQVGGPEVALLGHGLWTRRYGSDPSIVGRTIRLDGVPHTVVGVLPPDFNFPFNAIQLWLPMRADPGTEARGVMGTLLVGRLGDGWTESTAREELTAIQAELAVAYPEADGRYDAISLKPLREALNFAWDILQPAFLIMLVGVAFVLIIACVNVASLTLARHSTRVREVALRQALGAGRQRLVRQFLMEALLLAILGGALGVGLTQLGTGVFSGLIPPDIYRVGDVSLDRRVLLFSTIVTLSTPLFFALIPAWTTAKRGLSDGLKEGSSGGGVGRKAIRGRRALVVAEVALGVILVAGTGLMMRSLANALAIDVGFDTEQILTAELSMPASVGDDPVAVNNQFEAMIQGIQGLPGVTAVGTVSNLPLNHETAFIPFTTTDGLNVPVENRPSAHTSRAGPGYFEAMGIPLLAGRTFWPEDAEGGARGVLVSQSLADRLWPGESPLGRTVVYGRGDTPTQATIQGVVADIYYDGLVDAPRPHLYRPLVGTASRRRFLVISAAGASTPETLLEPVRRALFDLDPDVPAGLRPMADILLESTGLWAISSIFLGMFGLVALALAALGIYGVVAFSVSQRRRELGVRLALGADRKRILKGVVVEGLRVTSVGLVLGGVGAIGSGVLLSSLLLGVGAVDVLTLSGVVAVFLLVSAGAALIPARRAAAVEPAETLRME